MTTKRKADPIKKVELASGEVRYRFVVDVGRRPKVDRVNGEPVLDRHGRPATTRDQRTYTFRTLKEARGERARIISERSTGVLVRPNRKLTVAEHFGEWLRGKEGKKPATVQCYRDALRPLLDTYGHLPLQALDVPHLEAIKRGMLDGSLRRVGQPGKPLSARAVNLFLTTVTAGLRAAMKRRLVAINVGECLDRVESDPDAGADRGAWQLDDVRRFLAHTRGHRLYAAFLLSCCGMRRGEVLGLRWADVDLSGRLATERDFPAGSPTLMVRANRVQVAGEVYEVTPKSKASRRTLPLPKAVVAAFGDLQLRQREEIEAAGEAYRNEHGHVVVNELGQPYRPEWFSDEFVRQVKAAGLPRIPLHGARHAAASLLGAMGLPILHVAAWLGQSQISVTAGYQHAGAEGLSDVAERFSQVLAGDV